MENVIIEVTIVPVRKSTIYFVKKEEKNLTPSPPLSFSKTTINEISSVINKLVQKVFSVTQY